MTHLKEIWPLISSRRQMQLGAICVLMLFSACAELVSIGSVIPFLAAMASPRKLFEHSFVAPFISYFNIDGPDGLLLPFTLLFVSAAFVAASIRLLQLWASTRLVFAIGADISLEIYQRTLHQPYAVHIARNSNEVVSGITTKSYAVIYGGLLPTLQLISSIGTLTVIVGGLVALNPGVAAVTLFGFGLIYGVFAISVRKRLNINGKLIADKTTQVLKCLQDGLGGIRDIILDGSQSTYCKSYLEADLLLRHAQGNNQFIAASPRYAMEAIGLSMIAVLSYYLVRQPEGLEKALPLLGVLALGAQRLLPALQQAYSAWAAIKGSRASVLDAISLLKQPMSESHAPGPIDLEFRDAIRLNNVSFSYQSSLSPVLIGLNLTILRGERFGIIGATGSGKSTLMDILMGLLEPTEGTLEVDGKEIHPSSRRAWQSHIAHVPQAIYLADSSFEENIAFGVSRNEIVHERVREAARQAQIADLVESMPDGYHAKVGERGVRLSGGQRQRIGIARALYKRADVIVFDEATSALDSETETTVMKSIEALNPDLTVIIIAHRLSTLRKCDRIVELRGGRVFRSGTFEEIINDSPV